jgi:hypothetical protein
VCVRARACYAHLRARVCMCVRLCVCVRVSVRTYVSVYVFFLFGVSDTVTLTRKTHSPATNK